MAGPASIVLAGLSIFFVDGFGGQLAAPFIAYGLLWISTWLPQPAIVGRHDISYGAYIYAFPVQQLLAVFGAYHWGVLVVHGGGHAVHDPAGSGQLVPH